MRVVLVRHGETDYNVKKINQGWSKYCLTEKGKQQALDAGQKLT